MNSNQANHHQNANTTFNLNQSIQLFKVRIDWPPLRKDTSAELASKGSRDKL